MATAAVRLAEVQEAISVIAETGQSYQTKDGRRLTRANLKDLIILERYLQSQVNGDEGLSTNYAEM